MNTSRSPGGRPSAWRRRPVPALATAVLGVTAGIMLITMPMAEAAVAPVNGGVYTLASGASGKCIDVVAAGTGNGALLQQLACNTAATDMQFKAVSQAGGYGLVNTNSAKCMDVPYADSSSGIQLWQWTCGASTNQTWTFTASTAAAGKYIIKSVATGLCVSDKDGSTAGGNPIIQEPCSDIARMQWSFNYVTGATSSPTATAGTPTVASDGTGKYRTVQAAVDAVPVNNTSRVVITIKAGTYREIVTVPANKPYITLQGLGSSASNTVIVNNHYAGAYGTSGSATVFAYGHDFIATNLTISNDFDESSVTSGQQAVALHLNADRAVLTNVRLLGDQDTFLVNDATRAYVKNSYIEGTVDFIFGGGTIVFDGCSVYEKRSTGGPITAASTDTAKTYGFLFYKSTITGAANNVTGLGRPWRQGAQVLYRESTLSATIATAQPWTNMSTNTWQNARFFEYRNTGSGATVNGNRPQLADSQAANYTPQKYLAGSDGWNPIS
ncbi:pectinesterase [Hamadaea flava]|uniref:Pectinesterase n=1 Tax=Hamadaea flava TaxID=1742688 RepID=A0ABV8M183_9ACTN|nr:pectinesterase family protein [Hamadaea flava]MCP2322126.1 pectinesterase [Hamadaea flava]